MAYKFTKQTLKNGKTVTLVSWEGAVPPNHSSKIADRPWVGSEPRTSVSFYEATNEFMRNDWASQNMQPKSFMLPSASGQSAVAVMLYYHAASNTWHTSDALDIDHIVQWRDYFGQVGVANHAEANMAYNDVQNLRMLPSAINRARDSADQTLAVFGADSREWRAWVDRHFAFDPTKNHPDFDPDLDWAGRTTATQNQRWVPEDGRVGLRFDTKVLGKWFEAELHKSYVRSVTVTNAAGQTQEVPLFRCAASGQLVTRDAFDIDHHVPFDVLSKKMVDDAPGGTVSVAEMLDAYNDVSNLRLVSRSVNSSHEFEVDANNEFPDEEIPEIPGEFDDFIDDSPQLGVAPRLVTGVNVDKWAPAQVGKSYEDSDSRYGRQIILQLENDPAAAEAAARLAAKHPTTSVIVQLDEQGNYRVVYGDMPALAASDTLMRWQIVGHGRSDANGQRTLGGMGAANLARHLTAFHAKLTETIQKNVGTPARISLVGCTLERNGEPEGFGYRFASALKSPLIEVSIHTSDLAIDREGRKWPTSASREIASVVDNNRIASVVDDNKVVYRWRWEGGVVQTREQSKRIVLIGPDLINVEELVEDIRASNNRLSGLNAAERAALSRFYPNAAGNDLDETGLQVALASPVEYAKLLDVIKRIGMVQLGLPGSVGLGARALVNAEDDVAYRAAARQQLATMGTVKIDGTHISLVLLFDLGAAFDGSPLTPELATTLGADVSGKKIAFDPVRLVGTMFEVPTQAELEALANIVKRQLSGIGGDIAVLLRDGPLTDVRAGWLLETLDKSNPSALEVEVAGKIKEWYGDSASVRANWLSLAQGLDPAQRQLVQKLYVEASEASGFDIAEFRKFSAANPGLSKIEILQRMALDAAERKVRYDSDASAAMKIAAWGEEDAGQFLIHSKLAMRSEIGGINIDVTKLNQFIDSASAMNRIRITAAMLKLSGETYRTLRAQVKEAGTEASREFLSKVDDERTVLSNHNKEIAISLAGHALNAFMTLNSVRQLVGDWNRMNVTDKSLGLAMAVGGVAMSPLSTGIAKALGQFSKAINAVDRFGQAARVVEAGILDLALAPATFAAIGLQWKSFWSESGDTNSFEYKSLVANTVMTTVTTAVSLALTGVSIAASLSTAVASSVLGTIAASAGPIGVAIAAAGFIINGIVQGALIVSEYDQYFASTAAKVEAFFAAWIGIETDGVKRARAEQAAQADATKLQNSLNSEWEKTKAYLSDLFSKDGYRSLHYRERVNQVYHGTIKAQQDEFIHVLQNRPDFKDIRTIDSNRIADGGGVWAELASADRNYVARGVADKRNLFNLSGAVLRGAEGGVEADAFNLDAMTEVGTISGSDGKDTVVLDAGGLAVSLSTQNGRTVLNYSGQAVVIDGVTRNGDLATKVPGITKSVDQRVNVSGVESYIINNAGKADIQGNDSDEFFDVSGTDVAVSGGKGNNTYSLNQGNRISSSGDDIVLWNGKVDATVTLLGVPGKATQTLLIDLPDVHRDIRARRAGNDLQLSYETQVRNRDDLGTSQLSRVETRTLTISGIYGKDGQLDASKAIQFLDPHGSSFTLTSLGLIGDQWLPLSTMAKSFVFAATEDTGPRELINDKAVNTYSLKEGAGSFVARLHTNQLMQFVLEANLDDLRYSVSSGTLTVISLPDKPKLKLEILGYAEAVNAGALSLWLVPPHVEGKKPGIIGVELPTATVNAIGNLKAISNVAVQEQTDRELDKAKQPTYARTYDALKDSGIELQGTGSEAYRQLRIVNDLVLYQGDFADSQKVLVTGYFTSPTKPQITDRRGANAGILEIIPAAYAGDALSNVLYDEIATQLAGLDGADTYVIEVTSRSPARTVIDNTSADMKMDILDLLNSSNYELSRLQRAGDDLEIVLSVAGDGSGRVPPTTQIEKVIVLQNYIIDPHARHLRVKIKGEIFTLPSVDEETGYFIHQPGENVLVIGDGVHQLRVPKANSILLYSTDGFEPSNYSMTVQGYDLKLVKGGQTIYLHDYYRNPSGLLRASKNLQASGVDTTIIPSDFEADTQALFKRLEVPRDKWVPYILSGVDSEAKLTSIAALSGERSAENAVDFNLLPSERDFTVYLKTPAAWGSTERVLFATGAPGLNGFTFYVDGDGYLCYRAYVPQGAWNGVGHTMFSATARIYESKPVARANDTEFVLKFSANNILTVIAEGPNGGMVTSGINLNISADPGLNFSATRALNNQLLSDANTVRKVMGGLALGTQVDSILRSDGLAWGANSADIELYYKVSGFSEAGAKAAIAEDLTSVSDVGTTCLALKQSDRRLSEDFVIAYAKQKHSWLHAKGGVDYAEALEALGYQPKFILNAYSYGLSVQDVEVYASLEKKHLGKDRLADFALALYGKSKPYLMISAKPVKFLNAHDEKLLTSLLDTLEVPGWDRPRILHGVAGNASSVQLRQLEVLFNSNYVSSQQKKQDLQGWLVQAINGHLTQKASFTPGMVNPDEDKVLLKTVLINKGFLPSRAAVLAEKMTQAKVLDYEIVESLMNAGVSDAAQLGKLAKAGVSGKDLIEGNAKRLGYESGNRSTLIQVSTSLPLLQRTPSESDTYYAREFLGIGEKGDVHKLGSDPVEAKRRKEQMGLVQLIHPGPVLSLGGSVPAPTRGEDGLVWMWQQGYLDLGLSHAESTESGFGRSSGGNLVDGSGFSGEAFSWRGASTMRVVKEIRRENGQSVEKEVARIADLSLDQTDMSSSEIVAVRFDMKHKIALSSLTLKATYDPADIHQRDTTRDGTYIVEALSADNAWIKVSKADLLWAAKPGEKGGDKTDMTIALDTGGVPYQSYRVRGISGSYDRDRWLDEVTFTTAPIDLVQASAANSSDSVVASAEKPSTTATSSRDSVAPAALSTSKMIEIMAGFDGQSGVAPGITKNITGVALGMGLAPPSVDTALL
ncbi:C80 family cysteine peptidase [Lysobacter antibioticus]|uniref:C80 family cysteine peptidase n=1 Tax=Lysobacter antibioticus TaxID=84531 RepID=UPI000B088332|nr:C80 family cysteine peptidase [Lysobacter antibioticus]